MPLPACRLFLLILALLAAPLASGSQRIVVVTSFSKEITQSYKKAFEADNPGLRVEFLSLPSPRALTYILGRHLEPRPDLIWSSAPETFDQLAAQGYLQRLAPPPGGAAVDASAQPYFLAQAWSGYGIMWNTRYFAAKGLPPPATWADLGQSAYFGHLIMTSPARSGTTHLIVEQILQSHGWEAGWQLLLRIAGNCAEISERSFGVPNAVGRGQYGAGPVVDFLALGARNSGTPVAFIYPPQTSIIPANIAVLAAAPNPDGAQRFLAFTLSPAGQALLNRPEISRLPVLAQAQNPQHALLPHLAQAGQRFDRALSQRRYQLIGVLFDQAITFRHAELRETTRLLHAADRRLALTPEPQAAALVAEARRLLYRPPPEIAGADAAPLAERQTLLLENQVAGASQANYRQAGEQLRRALDLLR